MKSNPLGALADGLEIFRNILETSRDVFWTINKTGHFVYVSPSVFQQRGFTPEEVMTRPAIESICEDDRPKAMQTFSLGLEIIEKGSTRLPAGMIRLRQTHKNGTCIWTEIISQFFFNEDREFMFVLGMSRDISRLVAAENEIARLKGSDSSR